MKKNMKISLLFLVEILLCLITTRILKIEVLEMKDLLVYPFTSLGEKLFQISKGGNNFLAWLILIEIVLIPLAIFVILIAMKKFRKIHLMLPILSGYLFYILYIFINPSILINTYGKDGYYSIVDLEVATCYMFYILLVTYILFLLIGLFKKSNESRIITYLEIIIVAVGMLMVVNDVYINYVLSFNEYKSVCKELSSFRINTNYTKVFYTIKYIIELIPSVFYMLMAIKGVDILDEMRKDRFSSVALKKVKALSKLSMISIIIMITVNLVYNLATLPYLSKLYGNYRCFVFPVYFIVFTLCILLFAKYMEDTKKIKEDNDLFV